MQIGKNVHMLEVTGQLMTAYPTLMWDENNLILVDAGTPDMWNALCEAITNTGQKPEDITALVLTHQDMDHIGCVRDVLAVAPKAKVYAHIDEVPYIRGEKEPQKIEMLKRRFDLSSTEGKGAFEQFRQGFINRNVEVDTPLGDGDMLDMCGGITIIHSPGHTYGHICLLITSEKILIAGDALNIEDGRLIGANPMHTFDVETAKKSVQKLGNFDINKIVCYHSGLFEGNGKTAIAEAAGIM